jgi:hypothetical protein
MDPEKCNDDWEKVCQLAQRSPRFCLVYLAVNHRLDVSDADKSISIIGQLMCGGDKGNSCGSAQKIFSLKLMKEHMFCFFSDGQYCCALDLL